MKSFKGKNCYWASSTDLKIESLDEELRNANDLLAAKRAGVLKFTEDEMANLFPLAATTSKLLKKGMTLTEVRSTGVTKHYNIWEWVHLTKTVRLLTTAKIVLKLFSFEQNNCKIDFWESCKLAS